MLLVATRKADQSQAVLDPWSIVHIAAGLGAGLKGISFPVAFATAAIYEVVERKVQSTPSGAAWFKASGPEIPVNSVADVVLFGIGWWLGNRWNKT